MNTIHLTRVNLNDPDEFTLESIRQAIPLGDNRRNSQFRVTDDGYFFVSKLYADDDMEGIRLVFQTNFAYDTTVGPEAAADDLWVERIFKALKEWWPCPVQWFIHYF